MNSLFKLTLFSHVILGLIAIIASVTLWMMFMRRIPNFRAVKFLAGSTLFFFVSSWLTGGYYYLYHYGAAVRVVILEGPYPWAHKIIMETKEHVFLFLPFMAAAVFFSVRRFREGEEVDSVLRRKLSILITLMTGLGIVIALAGIAISGAAQPQL